MLNPLLKRRFSLKSQLVAAFAVIAVLLPLAALRAPAQGTAAKLTGTVYDPVGAVIAHASVVLVNPQVHFQTSTTADAVGRFSFTGFPVGIYEVQVHQPGFQPFSNPNVILNAGQETALNIKLTLGQVNDKVDVIAGGPPTPRATQPARIRVGGNVQATKLLRQIKPAYPESAQAARIEGAVVMEAVIDIDGSLKAIRVLNSVDPALDQAALAAVSQWKYQPTLLNGEPAEVIASITVNFKLP